MCIPVILMCVGAVREDDVRCNSIYDMLNHTWSQATGSSPLVVQPNSNALASVCHVQSSKISRKLWPLLAEQSAHSPDNTKSVPRKARPRRFFLDSRDLAWSSSGVVTKQGISMHPKMGPIHVYRFVGFVTIQVSYVRHHFRSAGGLGSELDENNKTPHPTIRASTNQATLSA